MSADILRNGRAPDTEGQQDEGWVPLNGEHGITLKHWEQWEFNVDEIFITETD